MKRALVLALFLSACICGLHAQAGDTTVCAVLKNPALFDGKMVTIKGAIVAGFDEFAIADGDCGLPVNASGSPIRREPRQRAAPSDAGTPAGAQFRRNLHSAHQNARHSRQGQGLQTV